MVCRSDRCLPLLLGGNIMSSVITFILANGENILGIVLGILGLFSIIARMTKTEADNKVVNFILQIVHSLGLTKPEAK